MKHNDGVPPWGYAVPLAMSQREPHPTSDIRKFIRKVECAEVLKPKPADVVDVEMDMEAALEAAIFGETAPKAPMAAQPAASSTTKTPRRLSQKTGADGSTAISRAESLIANLCGIVCQRTPEEQKDLFEEQDDLFDANVISDSDEDACAIA